MAQRKPVIINAGGRPRGSRDRRPRKRRIDCTLEAVAKADTAKAKRARKPPTKQIIIDASIPLTGLRICQAIYNDERLRRRQECRLWE